LKIRFARAQDALQIGRVYCESWKIGYRGILPSAFLDSLTEENCTPVLEPNSTLAAFEGSSCIGSCSIARCREQSHPKWGEITALYLLPFYFGTGTARILFEQANCLLGERGFQGF